MSHPGLGFDPAPGDPGAVAAAAAEQVAAADALRQVPPAVQRATAAAEGWGGAAADAFAARAAAVPTDVDAVATRLRAAARLLDEWAQVLADNRRVASDLDARARRLRAGITDAEDDAHTARNALDLAATPTAAAAAGVHHAAAEAAVTDLRAQLDEVLRTARTLAAGHDEAAARTADALDALRGAPGEQPRPHPVGPVLAGASATAAALARLVSTPGSPVRPPRGAGAALAAALIPAQTSREPIVVVEPRGPGRR
ncbi:hypothetical protein [Actinokineospora bangkokensis]|uniref:Uncharacterized protein n=1 Tax=Actinokineospora bangkokensis TaxID=1193682 RepID=A0A1Q9LFP3_9PSEU|nr:hypothetical protein [Actinokineospora bangkokensis]OLR90815.1 hypothetical protein BJP25_30055 [Actinokineospora bangkokensis]